jgi:hypothetical protein
LLPGLLGTLLLLLLLPGLLGSLLLLLLLLPGLLGSLLWLLWPGLILFLLSAVSAPLCIYRHYRSEEQ